jgi:hypothetical protein
MLKLFQAFLYGSIAQSYPAGWDLFSVTLEVPICLWYLVPYGYYSYFECL